MNSSAKVRDCSKCPYRLRTKDGCSIMYYDIANIVKYAGNDPLIKVKRKAHS